LERALILTILARVAKEGMTAVIRSALARRAASTMMSSSIKC